MQYYKYVDEVVAQPATWKGKNLQVHGYVVPGSIGRKRDSLEYRFDIQRNGKTMTRVLHRHRARTRSRTTRRSCSPGRSRRRASRPPT